jgi:hypothetical protein
VKQSWKESKLQIFFQKYLLGFIPFQNGGRRTCLGQEMAMLEVKAFLCCIMRAKYKCRFFFLFFFFFNFETKRISFELAPDQKILRFPNITLSAKNGIVVIPQIKR